MVPPPMMETAGVNGTDGKSTKHLSDAFLKRTSETKKVRRQHAC